MLNILFTIVMKMTLTFSRIIDFDDATNLFLKQVYSCAVVDTWLIWTDIIILISRPVCWDKLYQSTQFKGKLHKLPINTHYIHSVVTQDFVSGRACCVNQYHYESRQQRVVMRLVHATCKTWYKIVYQHTLHVISLSNISIKTNFKQITRI
jgi:hypothetical protein